MTFCAACRDAQRKCIVAAGAPVTAIESAFELRCGLDDLTSEFHQGLPARAGLCEPAFFQNRL
jgi:hypothetical protein